MASTRATPSPPPFEIRIESLAFGGDAVARAPDGRVVFCAFGAPGDALFVRPVEEHRSWIRAEIVRVVERSGERVEPRCRHFGTCGGCEWQHVSYAAQLRAKREIVEGALRRLGVAVEGPVPASSEYGTRRRVRMHARGGRPGFFARGRQRVIAVSECPVMEPRLWETIRAARPREDGELSGLAGPSGVHLSGAGVEVGAAPDLASAGDGRFVVPATVFAQASAEGDRALGACVLEWAESRGRGVLELFAGAGNFTRLLVRAAGAVTAVEGDGKAFEWLGQNAPEAERVRDAAAAAVRRLAVEGRAFDVCVLDPPRTGCRDLLADLASVVRERIVYISCDPMTLGRDLERLRDLGFATVRARCFDLMPQTSHVETVALAVRRP